MATVKEKITSSNEFRNGNAYNRSLIEASLDPLVTIGPDGRITDVNAATEMATGRTREELIGTDFSDYFTEPEKARAGYEHVFREGMVRDYALEIRRSDGHVTPVLYNAAVFRDKKGNVIGVFAAARDISERKKAEERIRQFAMIVESSDDAIINKTLDGTILSWNRGAESIYGYSAVEMTGQSISRLIPEECADDEKKILDRIAVGDHVDHYETLRLTKAGKKIVVSLTVSPIRDAEGRVVSASAIARDVTEKRRTAEELRRANAYNRSLIEASLDPLVTIGPDGKITDVNVATEWVTGRTRKELLGTDFCDYFGDPEKARAGYEHVFREGMVRDYALEIKRSDGKVTPVLYNAAVYRDENAKVSGVFAAARDITELKRAEESVRQLNLDLERRVEERTRDLKQSTAFLENLLEAIPEPVFYKDRQGVYLGGNEAFFKYLGKSREDVVGKDVYGISPKHLADIYKKADDDLMERGGMQVYESRVKYADGTEHDVIFHKAAFPNPDGSAGGLIGTILDISERKQNERERERLLSEIEVRATALEAANKELEAFAYSVSHDLRAPLRAIDGFSRMLEEDYASKLNADGSRILGVVRSETRKMGRLIDDLLEFSRISRREMAADEVDMECLARAVSNETRITAGQGRNIDIRIAALPPARGDSAMVRQVLVNLITNAVKFSRPREQAVIEISGECKDGENVYAVRDNGVGFDMKYAHKLFGVFQRLHSVEEFEGTGVGLAIVQRIIQRHGGRVWAEGAVDQGATFYFTLARER